MTEKNIRDAFELYAKNEIPGRELNRYGDGYANPSIDGKWFAFKAGWVAAFKVILESEND